MNKLKHSFNIKKVSFHFPHVKLAYNNSCDDDKGTLRTGVYISCNTNFSIQTYKNSSGRFGFIVISIFGFGFQLDYEI